jgi:DNA-binding transcriptional MerR regulator
MHNGIKEVEHMEIHKHYTIGQAAEETGLSIHTLRYYEKEGLLPNIKRSESGIRLFEDEDIQWIKLLQCLRRMDMPIVQLKEYAHLTLQTLQGHETMDERVHILENQKEMIEEHMNILKSHIEMINLKLDWYSRIKKEKIQEQQAMKTWLKERTLPLDLE